MPVHGLYLEAARAFQKAGITVLLYDNRGVGASDDTPRGEANAAKQTEDLHEAVFFLKRFPAVDARRIALGVIHFRGMRPGRRSVGQAHQSRCRHLPGRAVRLGQPGEAKPLPRPRDARHRIPCKRQPAALYGPCGLGDEDDTVYDYRLFRCTNAMTVDDVVSTLERIPGFSNQIPVRAFYNMISWAVRELVTAENEELPYVKRKYGVIYDHLTGPKELYVVPEKGHMDVLNVDERFDETVKVQVEFLAKYLI